MTYEYRQPSRVNVVSVFFVLVIAGGVYAAAKFVPVYWMGKKVDRELGEISLRASNLVRMDAQNQSRVAGDIIARATTQLHDLGVEDQDSQPLEVWFSDDYSELHARYQVVVMHTGNLIKPTVVNMDRVVEVSR